jgi:hypothetical protein
MFKSRFQIAGEALAIAALSASQSEAFDGLTNWR